MVRPSLLRGHDLYGDSRETSRAPPRLRDKNVSLHGYALGMPSWLNEAISEFGVAAQAKLAGPGEREALIRSPLEALLSVLGSQVGVPATFHDEVRDSERRVRPDYGVMVKGAIVGYIEVKAPDRSIDPASMTGHDLEQFVRLRDIPNLLYTNGTEWRLYRDGVAKDPAHLLGGSLSSTGSNLHPDDDFESLIRTFLNWKPLPITNVGTLVRSLAPLTRLLRGEVLDQIKIEHTNVAAGSPVSQQPFMGLAADWRALLFPTATDDIFADGYAQAVTFALLLAKTEGTNFEGQTLHVIGQDLIKHHSLMGRALQLLTDNIAADFAVTLSLLVRVVDSVIWPKVRSGRRDTYLHLYEAFLGEYDPTLREESGSYYTPRELVDEMVRLTADVLVSRLERPKAFLDPNVVTIDPAMGTGTFLHSIIEQSLLQVENEEGLGAVAGAATELTNTLIGFEIQMGPFAVAELRTADLMAEKGALLPKDGLKLYVTDTLDNPYSELTQLGSGLESLAASRRAANKIKAKTPVTVVIGNPPYDDKAEGRGGWIENGDAGGVVSPLEAFRSYQMSPHKHILKNMFVYFWRWATWKAFESTPDDDAGIITFITPSAYVHGPAFTAMREYMRRHASEGWIIDVTPEGQRASVSTRLFPKVQQPLAVAIFVRNAQTSRDVPANIHVRKVSGTRSEKLGQLSKIQLDDDGWTAARTTWTSPFTPAPATDWDNHPAINDVFPWTSPGVTGNRTWPFSPDKEILQTRWKALTAAAESDKPTLLKTTRDRYIDKVVGPLPPSSAFPVGSKGSPSIDVEKLRSTNGDAVIVDIGFRTFDRQFVIADNRVLDMARPPLWAARTPDQIFVVEKHALAVTSGPGLVFSDLMPELNYFDNRGGRTLPLFHPSGEANVAPGLLSSLSTEYGRDVTAENLLAYIAAVAGHPGFTAQFNSELTTPGIRVPVTAKAAIFSEAIKIGERILWAQTYGERFADPSAGRPKANIRFAQNDPRQPKALTPVSILPTSLSFEDGVLSVGDGSWGPVRQEVYEYAVGTKNVIHSWVNYRRSDSDAVKSTPLDEMIPSHWVPSWTPALTNLLTVLTRLVDEEPAQLNLLSQVINGPLLTMSGLEADGVAWPKSKADRKPKVSATVGSTAVPLDI
jgi:hypothetical protein